MKQFVYYPKIASRNPFAKAVRTPVYKSRVVKSKKIYNRKEKPENNE